MGFWVTSPGLRAIRVGTAMSELCLTGLFLAAYGVSRRPDSLRVRSGWVVEIPRVLKRGPSGCVLERDFHVGYLEIRKVQGLRRLIATNTDDQCWIEANKRTIDRGLMLRPPEDPNLQTLVLFYQAACCERNDGTLTLEEVRSLAPVLEALLPHLETSCWYEKCADVSALCSEAARAGKTLELSW